MVPKQAKGAVVNVNSFRVMLFRMVPKLFFARLHLACGFRVMLFRMVPKPGILDF
ncbi:TPA: hypothetical protein IUZ63_000838 [Enterococcus faecalis]|nr:hypothetical protein [Enterococcus faecalis]